MKKNQKRKINRKGIILISIILVLLVLIILYRYIYGINLLKQETNNNNDITNNTNQKEDKKVYQANMIMVGDVIVHDRLYNDAYNG